MKKDELCKAFCDDLSIRSVPIGFAVNTGFEGFMGDPIGFYIAGPDKSGKFRIQDDGETVWHLEASGADLKLPTRAAAFHELLEEYGFLYDEKEHTLESRALEEDEIAGRALRFVALLLRLQDLLLLVQERVASTFREEVGRRLAETMGNRADIKEREVIHQNLTEFPADFVLRSPNRSPVALFLATSDQRILEALLADSLARHEAHIDCSIVALLEKERSVSAKNRQLASNRLTAVASYRGDEAAAIQQIARVATGDQGPLH